MTKQELYQAQQAVVNDRKNGVTNNTLANKVQSDANYDPYQGLAAYTPGNGGGQAQAAAPDYAAQAFAAAENYGSTGVDTSYYDSMLAAYNTALEAQRRAREQAYQNAVSVQRNIYNQNVGKVNAAADKALRESYLNRMQAERIQPQRMAAQGLTGGISESTLASIHNNYGNSRNEIESGRTSQVSDLGTTLANNIASAQSILNNGVAGDYADYLDKTAALYAKNALAGVNTNQSAGSASAGSYYANLVKQMMTNGGTADSVSAALANAGLSAGQIRQYFAAAGF